MCTQQLSKFVKSGHIDGDPHLKFKSKFDIYLKISSQFKFEKISKKLF